MTTAEMITGTCEGQTVEVERVHTFAPQAVDTGKRIVEVLPGLKLAVMSKGYVALKIQGKDAKGRKVEVGKPLYRKELQVLIDALAAELSNTVTFEEANGTTQEEKK